MTIIQQRKSAPKGALIDANYQAITPDNIALFDFNSIVEITSNVSSLVRRERIGKNSRTCL